MHRLCCCWLHGASPVPQGTVVVLSMLILVCRSSPSAAALTQVCFWTRLQAAALAQSKLEGHWALGGEVQQGLTAACDGAARAAQLAQAARQAAQFVAARLDAAAALVDDGSRSAQIKLVAHPVPVQQLHDLSVS
eukprot:GHUV01043562.1.p1 GENE.GHUV01043562.1~~GHUV01043562.1.p1  ORF type:complete len:135 (+),score=55.89 GHUV01043562.1:345-749(+)